MCMYFTKGINQNGYIMCLHCNMKKYEHPIFSYIYDITFQCDDIVLLIQEYIKTNNYNNIAGGHEHSSVLLKDNTVKCWGNNYYNQCDVPDSIQGKVVSIDCGGYYSCALLNNNTVKCWSINSSGICNVPDSIQGKVESISCGYGYCCVLLYDNTIECWGNNSYGQCNVPDSIQGKVISISCGNFYTSALLNDNTIRCWGDNNDGQCNVPDSIQDNNHNVNINNDNVVGKVISIKCGGYHSCALLNNNTIKCWGNNSYGQCNVPDSIQGKVVSISCGNFYTSALLNDNTIRCWGDNMEGQCNVPDSIQGNNHNVNINNDNIVGKVVSIDCGSYHFCALLDDNTIKCWGDNKSEQCNVPDSIQGKIMRKN